MALESLGEYGRAVVVAEGRTREDKQSLLNVVVARVHHIIVNHSYNALSMLLGSELEMELLFTDQNARLFARNVEGINTHVVCSHPHVVHVDLNNRNHSVVLRALSAGEANIMFMLQDDDSVFDVVRVRVLTLLEPRSPINVVRGAIIKLRFSDEYDGQIEKEGQGWVSEDPEVVQVIDSSQTRPTFLAVDTGRSEKPRVTDRGNPTTHSHDYKTIDDTSHQPSSESTQENAIASSGLQGSSSYA